MSNDAPRSGSRSDIIPCDENPSLRQDIKLFAEELRHNAGAMGFKGMTTQQLHESGIFRGAIEQLRGEMSASMDDKRQFTETILDWLKDNSFIKDWRTAGSANRYDYGVDLNSGRFAAIESKGCLDGNNSTIFERPANADEFIIWSVCQNAGANPRHNVWSGIHTRLSAEIISRQQVVDGLIIWDAFCGTNWRPCPKLQNAQTNVRTAVGRWELPPPCIYLFPRTVPTPRANPKPALHNLAEVEFLQCLHQAFHGDDLHLNFVEIEAGHKGPDTVRTTSVTRNSVVVAKSRPTPIKRK